MATFRASIGQIRPFSEWRVTRPESRIRELWHSGPHLIRFTCKRWKPPQTAMSPLPQGVTELLFAWRNGSRDALGELMPLVYNQLRTLAEKHMRSEDPGHT